MEHSNNVFVLVFSCCFLSLLYRRCYIRFIRKVNDKKGMEGQEETRKAFDFMLNYVGKLFPLVPFVLYFSFLWIIVAPI